MFNLAIRFALELAGVVAVGYVGYQLVPSGWRLMGAIAGAAALVALWGTFLAPRANSPIPLGARELIGTVLLLAVAAAVALSGQLWLGLGFAALLVVNQSMLLATGAVA